nr:PR domain zinc finger protein 8, putative isoform 1 [Tanacetum cinerariifolium]
LFIQQQQRYSIPSEQDMKEVRCREIVPLTLTVVKDKKQKSSAVTSNLLLTKEEGLEVYEDMYLGRAFEDMCFIGAPGHVSAIPLSRGAEGGVISTSAATISEKDILSEIVAADVLMTPPSAPRLSGIAETCPGAPMKPATKLRNIDSRLCRKLEF